MSGGNNTSNTTFLDIEQPNATKSYAALLMSIFLVAVPGLTANSLAFYCIIPDIKTKKTIVKHLLLSLCVADFCGCIGVLQLQILSVFDDVPRSVCALSSFFTVYFPMLSGAIATFMACERCAALRAPYWYQQNMLKKKFWAFFLVIVCLIAIVCILPLVGLGDVVRISTEGNRTVVVCGSFPNDVAETARESTFAVTYGVVGLVMVVLNVSLNVLVLQTLHKMKQRINPSSRNRKDTSQEFEMTKMLLVLSLTFLICWFPLNIFKKEYAAERSRVILAQSGREAHHQLRALTLSIRNPDSEWDWLPGSVPTPPDCQKSCAPGGKPGYTPDLRQEIMWYQTEGTENNEKSDNFVLVMQARHFIGEVRILCMLFLNLVNHIAVKGTENSIICVR